jgi:hypothetical protein
MRAGIVITTLITYWMEEGRRGGGEEVGVP